VILIRKNTLQEDNYPARQADVPFWVGSGNFLDRLLFPLMRDLPEMVGMSASASMSLPERTQSRWSHQYQTALADAPPVLADAPPGPYLTQCDGNDCRILISSCFSHTGITSTGPQR
jgi:hypothetical protein